MPGEWHFYQMVKVNLSRKGNVPPASRLSVYQRCVAWSGHRKHQINPEWRDFLQSSWAVIFKSVKIVDMKETLGDFQTDGD